MADTPAIQTEALVKRYGRGGTTALKGLDISVSPGRPSGSWAPTAPARARRSESCWI